MHCTKTKIICTIGPACDTLEKMLQLIEKGMNVARLNFSHGSHREHAQVIALLKEARRIAKQPLAILLDTKGPEIRLGDIASPFKVERGQTLKLLKADVAGNSEAVSLRPGFILNQIPLGTKLLIDNGYLISVVTEAAPDHLVVTFENSGEISSNKGVNIPNLEVGLPAVTEKDLEDIRFGVENQVDFIAASFVRSADHVLEIKAFLRSLGNETIQVLAKIENSRGIEHFDSILQVADGIMIARGDLGVEIPLSQVPKLQKMMIRKSYLFGKPAVTATQMLESMILNPRPTRAEASDVANAIYDGTSAVMLSGETAVGRYPVETVEMMRNIALETEKDLPYRTFFNEHSQICSHDIPSSVTLAAVKTAYSAGAKALFAFTYRGLTAALLSRLRPSLPIIALTISEKTYHQLALSWGIVPFLSRPSQTVEEGFSLISSFSLRKGLVAYGDLVVSIASAPFKTSAMTNMIVVDSIGAVLVRGHQGFGERVWGSCSLVLSLEAKEAQQVQGRIAVLNSCSAKHAPLLEKAAAIVLQNQADDSESENWAIKLAQKFSIPLIVRADAACTVLHEGQIVTLDPENALIYRGAEFDLLTAAGPAIHSDPLEI